MRLRRLIVAYLLGLVRVQSFIARHASFQPIVRSQRPPSIHISPRCTIIARSSQVEVSLDVSLTDEKVAALFAWVTKAFAGDERYNNLYTALVSVFGNLPDESAPMLLLREATAAMPGEEELVGAPLKLRERESYSLGAMGAGQWTGQFYTRPHALLSVRNLTSVDQWVKSLPRGCRRTLAKATPHAQNFTVVGRCIRGGEAAPHSSLAHFRCVLEHEVRLIADFGGEPDEEVDDFESFVEAVSEAVGRYMGTTRMAGEIREYRDVDTGKVLAFAHEVRKGSVWRGQWFYATNEAARRYVWFHSVYDLVRRAVEESRPDGGSSGSGSSSAAVIAAAGGGVDTANDSRGSRSGSGSGFNGLLSGLPAAVEVVDLGPSGSDAFSDLKARYGFTSVEDWPAAADYLGPFVHSDNGEVVGDKETAGGSSLLGKLVGALKQMQ